MGGELLGYELVASGVVVVRKCPNSISISALLDTQRTSSYWLIGSFLFKIRNLVI